jgi:N-acetylmuramoyl-L-alanine amidase
MNAVASGKTKSKVEGLARALALLGCALFLFFALGSLSPARADRKTDARDQFERSVRLRTILEGSPQKERKLADYKQVITSFHRVYLITPSAEEVTPALIAEAELYEEMGRAFDAKYFQNAIETYNFLLKQYPGSRYRGEALFSIGALQKDELSEPEAAEVTLKDYLRRFPKSDKSDEARAALKEIADSREKAKQKVLAATVAAASASASASAVGSGSVPSSAGLPELKGKIVDQHESEKGTPRVMDVKTWNAADATRIVVTLEDTVSFNSAHIASPDRIYFDIHKAKLTPPLAKRTLDVKAGLLKSVRIGQNRDGVVRLVLDVDGARDANAYLLSNPYRLVIEVKSNTAQTAKSVAPPAAAAPAPAPAANESAAGKPETDAKLAAVTEASSVSSAANAKTAAIGANASSGKESAKAPVKTPAANSKTAAKADTGKDASKESTKSAELITPTESKPTRDGNRSLTRALGLKINRIVIDAGHGGHDTGTIGPHGLMEKDLCLDVALKLGKEIEEKLPGADVIYTRKDDTFIPLEQRTQIANDAKADLFISVHANSSHDSAARGIETYYLNFATSAESMEVASRENALAQESLHDLQDIIKKIARNEKVEESKELASDIQDSLTHRLQLVNQNERNRGVKKAPFVVLIGANMPSVLSEISFISNPNDEKLLRKTDQRQRVADGLYRGIASYLESLNSLSYDKSKLVSDNRDRDRGGLGGGGTATVAADGNPK